MRESRIVGAVLTGGHSTRMGRDKSALRMPDGRTMAERVVDSLAPLCGQVVLVGAVSQPWAGVSTIVRDLRPGCGPLGGIEALLASALSEQYLVCACDSPLVNTNVLQLLMPSAHNSGEIAPATVLRPRGRERFECLPLRISANALGIVRKHLDRGEYALWRFVQSLDPQIIEIDESQMALLRNVNTPEEFRAITSVPTE
jgi:molybdopterin-guanine dinucleotide biosynthesis protein A